MKYSLLIILALMVGCASNPREEESHNRLERVELKLAEQKELILELKEAIKDLTEELDENFRQQLQELKNGLDPYNSIDEKSEDSSQLKRSSNIDSASLEDVVSDEIMKLKKK